MIKTRKEIIDETEGAFTLGTRAVVGGLCQYLTPDGKMCAVGRCMESPKTSFTGSLGDLYDGAVRIDVESLLKPEYRGHPIEFWIGFQRLHDNGHLWTSSGLSNEGRIRVAILHDMWDEKP